MSRGAAGANGFAGIRGGTVFVYVCAVAIWRCAVACGVFALVEALALKRLSGKKLTRGR